MGSNLPNISYKQFQRTYPGGYSLNFSICLSGNRDFTTKNYTNFYLTDSLKISESLTIDTSPLKAVYVNGPIQYGDTFLSFIPIDSTPYASLGRYSEYFNYGLGKFINSESLNTDFTIKIIDDNKCNIYYTQEYKKYYLCADIDNNLVFVKEKLLTFDDAYINPQDFTYLFSESDNNILFFKKTENGTYLVIKTGDNLGLQLMINNNVISYIATSFKIAKSLYSYPNVSLNTSYITYTNNNNIDLTKSDINLKNNLLIHRKYSNSANDSDVIVLKNQVLSNDVFSSANTLLSGDNILSVDGLREYTSIFNDIKEEKTEDLELNYVFYNKPYKIQSGSNEFVSPSSLVPFTAININDTKFVQSGAFSYITPQYADKVYHLSNETQNYDNKQHLLCTWLSGSPFGTDKIWVDRYYYPDLIEKGDALAGRGIYNPTYDEYIEQLIQANSGIQSDITTKKYFDKRSDLIFTPNQKYRYDRLTDTSLTGLSSSFTYCNEYSNIYPSNYFKKINTSGEFTLGFNFLGDDSDWVIESDRNGIQSGLFIEKNGTSLTITYNIYDATTYDFTGDWLTNTITTTIKELKTNFLCVSVNSKTGKGYFFLNEKILLSFTIPIFQFTIKNLLYGDFFSEYNGKKVRLLSPEQSIATGIFINDYFIDANLAFILPILIRTQSLNDIYITLPCGMRNGFDNIDLLNSIYGTNSFKSNNINVNIKNLNIGDESIKDGLSEYIKTAITKSIPNNVNISTVEFNNYK